MAICSILSLAIVLGCDFFCDLGLISFSFPKPIVVTVAHSDEDHDHSSDHHNDVEEHSHHDHSANADHHSNSSDKGCCDDLTQHFYTSLTSSPTNNPGLVSVTGPRLLATYFLGDVIESLILTPFSLVNSKFQHLPNSPPGISGQVRRVFISSFLI